MWFPAVLITVSYQSPALGDRIQKIMQRMLGQNKSWNKKRSKYNLFQEEPRSGENEVRAELTGER